MSWLFVPSACSAALACSTRECELGSPTWASRIAPFATLSGKLTQPASWSRAWKKAAWMQRLSGPTLSPSTLDRFVAAWISSLQDSPAKTSASPADGPVSTGSAAGSSSRSCALPTIAVREASFWRTSQASLLPPPPLWTRKKASSTSGLSPESWGNWPTAGGMRNGSLFQRPTWEPATAAHGGSATPGGAWLTPHGMSGQEAATGRVGAGGEFAKQATNWTMAKASDGEKGGPNMRGTKGDLQLPAQSTQWPTPTAALMNDGEDPAQWQARADRLKAAGKNGNGAGMPLTVASAAWPTPSQRDGDARRAPTRADSPAWQNKVARGSVNAAGMLSDDLNSSAANWPTPAARDYRTPNSTSYQDRSGTSKGEQLVNFVAHHFSPPARLTEPGQTSSPQPRGSLQLSASKSSAMPRPLSRRLNPFFVEWLMGWPLGWTSTTAQPVSSASATEWYRCRLQLHLSSLFGELAMNDSGQSTHRRAA